MEPADPSSLPVPTAAPPAEESALALESRLLGLALRELRQTRDAKQALIRLDEYASRFPSGLLKEEAQAARVDALMVLGRRQDALVLLDQATFTRLPRGGELTVLRGELRAASGRCRDALPDFAASVEASSTAEVAERGLYGQGMCRAHLGDLSGAEIDLRAYLARFPSGRFRASAQATLRNLSATP
jgi:tetratricopeptide (TPR) repeat protein